MNYFADKFRRRVFGVIKNEGFYVFLRNVFWKIEKYVPMVRYPEKFSKWIWRWLMRNIVYSRLPNQLKKTSVKGDLSVISRRTYKRLANYYYYHGAPYEEYLANPNNPKKRYVDLPFAAYFQCFNNHKATAEALKSFRGFYPDVPVHLISDKGDDFAKEAEEFKCDYTYSHQNIGYWPCKNMIGWFKRLYDTCLMYPQAEWILLLEDDVRVRDRISKFPEAHLAGQSGGIGYNHALLNKEEKRFIRKMYPGLEINGYSGAGGSIFHRKSFIECFENIEKYDLEKLKKMDERLTWATDISLTFLFHLNGFINRRWFDYSADSEKDYGPAAAFDHQYKIFY